MNKVASLLDADVPACFVDHFTGPSTTLEVGTLYDPFEGTTVPGVYCYTGDRPAGPQSRRQSTARSTSARGAAGNGEELERNGGDAKHSVNQDNLRIHGLSEACAIDHKNQTARRIDLQRRSGQAIADTRARCSGHKGLRLDDAPTAERLRQLSVRDYPHACWVSKNIDKLEYYAETREGCLETMHARRLDNLELENYCGVTQALRRMTKSGI